MKKAIVLIVIVSLFMLTACKSKEEKWRDQKLKEATQRAMALEGRMKNEQADLMKKTDQRMKDLEAEYKKQLKEIEEKADNDSPEIKEAIKQLKKLREEEGRKAEQKTEAGQLVAITGVDKKPVKKNTPAPQFTPELKKKYKGKKWNIRAILLIRDDGSVAAIRTLTKLPDDVKKCVETTLKDWKYTPAAKDGVTVQVWLPVAFPVKQ